MNTKSAIYYVCRQPAIQAFWYHSRMATDGVNRGGNPYNCIVAQPQPSRPFLLPSYLLRQEKRSSRLKQSTIDMHKTFAQGGHSFSIFCNVTPLSQIISRGLRFLVENRFLFRLPLRTPENTYPPMGTKNNRGALFNRDNSTRWPSHYQKKYRSRQNRFIGIVCATHVACRVPS